MKVEPMSPGTAPRISIRVAGALGLFAFCAIWFLFAGGWMTGGGALFRWDLDLLEFVRLHRTPFLDDVMRFFTMLGNWQTAVIGTVCAVSILMRAGKRRCAAMLLVSVNAGALFVWVAKAVVHRARPPGVHAIAGAGGFSFPSGHAFVAFSFYCCVLYCLYSSFRTAWVRWVSLVCGTVLAPGIGVSRVYLGVHWPSDVLAGWIAGAVWLAAFIAVSKAERVHPSDQSYGREEEKSPRRGLGS